MRAWWFNEKTTWKRLRLWLKIGICQTIFWIGNIILVLCLQDDWGLPAALAAITCVYMWTLLFLLRNLFTKV